MRFIAGFLAAIGAILLGAFAIMYSGAYNIAASEPHTSVGRWILATAMQRSVEVRADSVSVPAQFTDQQVTEGLHAYDQMCAVCHGAPGKERSEIGKGLRPQPPNLADTVKRWKLGELFWIVKHGIKMSGMPAFGDTHGDDQLWQIVAFVNRLPSVTAEQYSRALAGADPTGKHSH